MSSPPAYASKWKRDINLTLASADCAHIWQETKSASPNIVALETNYKVLTRWYLVPTRISKFLLHYSPQCFRGCTAPGTHAHIWWKCPTMQTFWTEVFKILSTLFETSLNPDPAVALLNKPLAVTHHQFKLLLFNTTEAKQTFAKTLLYAS